MGQQLRKRYYKILGTSVMNNPMSPPSLQKTTLPLDYNQSELFSRAPHGTQSFSKI